MNIPSFQYLALNNPPLNSPVNQVEFVPNSPVPNSPPLNLPPCHEKEAEVNEFNSKGVLGVSGSYQ